MAESWIDCHVHVLSGGVGELAALAESQKAYGYSGSNFLSVEGMGDAAQNAMAILFKCLDPAHYGFGGLHYRFTYDFSREISHLYDIGLDGIKMIENKPTERKRLGYAQDDPRYDKMFTFAEDAGIPFLIHAADPRDFWDPAQAPEWAVQAGFAYADGSFTPFEQILGETVRMLERHPRLKVCMAHLMFLSDDRQYLRKLMDRFPNLHLDITAGTEMYYSFTEEPEQWRQFFLDYQDRILFGTDNCNRVDAEDREIGDRINDLEKRFLTENVRFPLWDREIQGAGLPEPVVGKITRDNFRNFTSPSPRPIDREKAMAYLRERLQRPDFCLTDRERTIILNTLSFLEK